MKSTVCGDYFRKLWMSALDVLGSDSTLQLFVVHKDCQQMSVYKENRPIAAMVQKFLFDDTFNGEPAKKCLVNKSMKNIKVIEDLLTLYSSHVGEEKRDATILFLRNNNNININFEFSGSKKKKKKGSCHPLYSHLSNDRRYTVPNVTNEIFPSPKHQFSTMELLLADFTGYIVPHHLPVGGDLKDGERALEDCALLGLVSKDVIRRYPYIVHSILNGHSDILSRLKLNRGR